MKYKVGDILLCRREKTKYTNMIGRVVSIDNNRYRIKVKNCPLSKNGRSGTWIFEENEVTHITKLHKALL